MRALVCRAIGETPALSVEELAPPPVKPQEVRIAVKTAGLNFPDVLMLAGRYQVKPELPFTPGLEAARTIGEVGRDVRGLVVGQRVLALTRRGGCFATELAVDGDRVVPIPDSMDYFTAACFPLVYGTAHFALTHRGSLRAGETLFVTGAAGGLRHTQRSRNATGRNATLRAPRSVPLHHRANKAQMKSGLPSSLDETRGSAQFP